MADKQGSTRLKQSVATKSLTGNWLIDAERELNAIATRLHLWDLEGFVLDDLVMTNKATDEQRRKRDELVVERRAHQLALGILRELYHQYQVNDLASNNPDTNPDVSNPQGTL